jgi:hypothetical protein
MTSIVRHLTQISRRPARVAGRLARWVAAAVAECRTAQRRLAIKSGPDRYLANQDAAPETYQEFLYRTSGPLAHEPAAVRRAAGRAVR